MELYFDIRPDFRWLIFKYLFAVFWGIFFILSISILLFITIIDISNYFKYKKDLKSKKNEFLESLFGDIDNLKDLSWDKFIFWLKKLFSTYGLSFDVYKEVVDNKEKKFLEEFLYRDVYNDNVEYILKKYLDVLKDKIYVDFVK